MSWSRDEVENPSFIAPLDNISVAVGREAIFTCLLDVLGMFKVAWLRVDTQTILTIETHVITKNHRIGVTHSQRTTWFLHIKQVKEADRGWYMCQVNTDPMKCQIGFLDVVVPPEIIDTDTSSDIKVREGANVNLVCVAKGIPTPSISWKRESGDPITLSKEKQVDMAEGPFLNMTRVSRELMGPYLCIASNGVPPSVSKRVLINIQFPPTVWVKHQLVGAYEGQNIILECHTEASPRSINYWTNENDQMISHTSDKYNPHQTTQTYHTYMKLVIKKVVKSDYGKYKCVAKNTFGETEETINVYGIPKSSIQEGISDGSHNQTGSLLHPAKNINSSGNLDLLADYYILLFYFGIRFFL